MKYLFALGMTVSSIMGWIAFMAADNQPPYSYIIEQSYIKPDPAAPGKQVQVHWAFKINRLCPGSIIRSIVDAKTMVKVSYDPTPVLGTIGIRDGHLNRTFLLPEGMMPGKKIYRANAEYVCNPLQRIWPLKVQTPDLYFVVE